MRSTSDADLDQCVVLAPDRFLYDAAGMQRLRRMWSHIIATGAGEAGVLVDPARPAHVLFCAFSVFVDDERAERYHQLTAPGIARGLAEEFALNARAFLSSDEIGRSNAGNGLNLVVTHYAFAVEAGDDGLGDKLRYASYESFRKHHEGLNFRSFTNEVFDRHAKQMGEGWGFRVGRYTDQQLRAANIPRERAPCVWMATRDDARDNPGAVFPSVLFRTFIRPRFGFNAHEQRLLRLALEGQTDEAIADTLGVSVSTAKKRFRAIYDKVHDASGPEVLTLDQRLDGGRGAEMRRFLLNHLRNHPEELHPYNAATLRPLESQRT